MAPINAAAPRIIDHLCAACAEHFAGLRAISTRSASRTALEPGLVRGLDYYTRTAFEFYVAGRAKASSRPSAAGGRYDGLIELLGGRPHAGNRVRARSRPGGPGPRRAGRTGGATDLAAPRARRGRRLGGPERTRSAACVVATQLRAAGTRGPSRSRASGSSAGRWRRPSRDGAHFAVILGDELADGQVQLRDLKAGTQRLVAAADLATRAAIGPSGSTITGSPAEPSSRTRAAPDTMSRRNDRRTRHPRDRAIEPIPAARFGRADAGSRGQARRAGSTAAGTTGS